MFNINIEYAMSNWVICQACIQRFIANLATDIRIVFGESKGYSVRNLKYMSKFAEISSATASDENNAENL